MPGISLGELVLQWADPLGASSNDYDLFLVDTNGDVLASSTDTQDGTQDPIEVISTESIVEDARVVVVKASGADRFLRLQTFGGRFDIATAGNTYGHAAAENAIGVAAVAVDDAGGAGGVFDGTESVETYSSDGPRRVFFESDGTAITPGDFSSSGGKVLQKPDLAAGTCVSTATPGFTYFCGTSAAAPHAAAMGALLLEAAGGPARLTLAQLRAGMTGAALDIEAEGVDRDSGAGIVMAPGAVDAVDVAAADRNRAPTVASVVADRTVMPGSNAITIALASTFSDPDGDTLTYTTASSDRGELRQRERVGPRGPRLGIELRAHRLRLLRRRRGIQRRRRRRAGRPLVRHRQGELRHGLGLRHGGGRRAGRDARLVLRARSSYWDLETSGVRVGVGEDDANDNGVIDGAESHHVGVAGMTTAELQGPTDYTGIYASWNVDVDGSPARVNPRAPRSPSPGRSTVAGPAVTLSVSDASATEGDAVEFTVSLSSASGQEVQVSYRPHVGSGDTATSDDFSDWPGGVALFSPGSTSVTVSVSTTDDSVEEEDETFTLTLSSPTNATLGDATATGTIIDDDAAPLTAAFTNVPSSHDGENAFRFTLTFSEDVGGLSYKTLRDTAFDVTGGSVKNASRRTPGSNKSWNIDVDPGGYGAVKIVLPETTNCNASGAICTGDGRPLSRSLSATVAGPVGISVADASVEEAAGASLAFVVTLSRAASGTVTVDYSTADGSAQAGADYTAASGTVSFQAGESSKTIQVAILDDSHDEEEETLTLTLSNASGGRLTDSEATGTIENHDPLPRALLARFGRTAAVHVVEQVEERIEAPRTPGLDGRFAGRDLRPGMEPGAALSFFNQLGGGVTGVNPGGHGSMAGSSAVGAGSLGMRGLAGGAPTGAMGHVAGLGGPAGRMAAAAVSGNGRSGSELYQMGLGGGDLLTGSSFAMNRETRHGGILSVWSRGAEVALLRARRRAVAER